MRDAAGWYPVTLTCWGLSTPDVVRRVVSEWPEGLVRRVEFGQGGEGFQEPSIIVARADGSFLADIRLEADAVRFNAQHSPFAFDETPVEIEGNLERAVALALSQLLPPGSRLDQVRRRIEELVAAVEMLAQENRELLVELEEGRQTIEQLDAQVRHLRTELRRARLKPERVAPSVTLIAALVALVANGLLLVGRTVEEPDALEDASALCVEIIHELER